MSAPIISPELETEGWLLEQSKLGDGSQWTVMRLDGSLIAVALPVGDRWMVSLCDGTALAPMSVGDEDMAVAWLTYLANLNTRSAA